MEEDKEVDPYTDYEVKETRTTVCDHFYCEDAIQDPNTELMSVMCVKCWHGCMIEPDKFHIKEGKICRK